LIHRPKIIKIHWPSSAAIQSSKL